MNRITKLSLTSSLFATLALPAFAGITIASPTAGEWVSSSFKLSANASSCSSQPVSTMGYSFDSSSTTTTMKGTAIDASLSAGLGTHTVHVKAWGDQGASCVADVTVTVGNTTTSGATSGLSAPSTAIKLSSIQAFSDWRAKHDSGTGGSSSGSISLAGSPSRSGNARRFVTSYSNYGGERYTAAFSDDTAAKNFLYDGWVFLADTASTVANIEMDLNQVMSNGMTVIFGFQCDGWSGTWDYTANKGTPTSPKDQWVHSAAKCSPRKWAQNTWHHVQISFSRDSYGNVTYHSVALDGATQSINATVNSAFKLGWAPTLLTNFQIDGAISGSASATVYLDSLTLYRW